mmetsp:Transcript_12459/g.33026  ORF Transcript_12459/g.33026 Transcript_12459/m.33026 type:complete len:213 (-) Transcript_12459:632-1270(-)
MEPRGLDGRVLDRVDLDDRHGAFVPDGLSVHPAPDLELLPHRALGSFHRRRHRGPRPRCRRRRRVPRRLPHRPRLARLHRAPPRGPARRNPDQAPGRRGPHLLPQPRRGLPLRGGAIHQHAHRQGGPPRVPPHLDLDRAAAAARRARGGRAGRRGERGRVAPRDGEGRGDSSAEAGELVEGSVRPRGGRGAGGGAGDRGGTVRGRGHGHPGG